MPPPRKGSGKLLIFIGKLILFLIVVAFLFSLVAPSYNRSVVWISNGIIALLERPYQRTLLKPEREDIQVYLSSPDREPKLIFTQGGYGLYYDLILLLALLSATPNLRILRRTNLTLISLSAIYIFQVIDLTVVARSAITFHSWPVVFMTFIEPAIPVLLWGLLTFRYWLPLPKAVMNPDLKSAKVGPNDPCPCGSGRKYKYCCGRRS